jgi:hypothetical protein
MEMQEQLVLAAQMAQLQQQGGWVFLFKFCVHSR